MPEDASIFAFVSPSDFCSFRHGQARTNQSSARASIGPELQPTEAKSEYYDHRGPSYVVAILPQVALAVWLKPK